MREEQMHPVVAAFALVAAFTAMWIAALALTVVLGLLARGVTEAFRLGWEALPL